MSPIARRQISRALLAALFLPVVMPAFAQSFRDQVAGSGLGSAYAQLINLTASPDVTAAYYGSEGEETDLDIDLTRLPYVSRGVKVGDDSLFKWRVAAGYMQMRSDFTVGSAAGSSVASRWQASSLTGGLLVDIPLAENLRMTPGLDVGVAVLKNTAQYYGAATALSPLFDGLVFNWETRARLVTPNLGLDWTTRDGERKTLLSGHLSWSWIESYAETDPALGFSQSAGVVSLRGEHGGPTGMSVVARPIDWLVIGSVSRLLGDNSDVLGFSELYELGVGMEIPFARNDAGGSNRARLTASYLFGSGIKGWTIGLGARF